MAISDEILDKVTVNLFSGFRGLRSYAQFTLGRRARTGHRLPSVRREGYNSSKYVGAPRLSELEITTDDYLIFEIDRLRPKGGWFAGGGDTVGQPGRAVLSYPHMVTLADAVLTVDGEEGIFPGCFERRERLWGLTRKGKAMVSARPDPAFQAEELVGGAFLYFTPDIVEPEGGTDGVESAYSDPSDPVGAPGVRMYVSGETEEDWVLCTARSFRAFARFYTQSFDLYRTKLLALSTAAGLGELRVPPASEGSVQVPPRRRT